MSEKLLEQDFAGKVNKDREGPRWFPTGLAHTDYAVRLTEDLRAYLWINAGSGRFTNRMFDALHEDKEIIEAEIEAEWFWEDCGNRAWAWLGIRRDGSFDDLPERAEELQSWAVEHLSRLKAVLNPRLGKVIGEVRAERAAAEGETPEAGPGA